MDVIIATFLLHEFHFKFLVQQLHSQEVNYPDVYHFRHDDFSYDRNDFFSWEIAVNVLQDLLLQHLLDMIKLF